MTAKQWLMRARNIDREIDALLHSLSETRDRVLKITQSISGDTVQSTKDPHRYDRLAELEEEIDEKVDNLVRVKAEIVNTVARIDDQRLREILTRRYVDGATFEQIAVDMGFSWRQTHRLHGEALLRMEVVLDALNLRLTP